MVDLNGRFRNLDRNFIPPEWDAALDAYDTEQFFPRLKKNLSSEELNPSAYQPFGQAARYLQYYYIASNPNPVSKKTRSLMLVMAAPTPKLIEITLIYLIKRPRGSFARNQLVHTDS